MPRRSGARTSSSPRAAPQRSAPQAAAPMRAAPPPPPPPPAPAAAPPPPMPAQGGGMMSGMMGSMASGMAAGVGMSVASRAVDAVMGPRQTEVVHRHEGAPAAEPTPAPAADKCMNERDWLKQCHTQSSDPTNCNYYADLLKQCQGA